MLSKLTQLKIELANLLLSYYNNNNLSPIVSVNHLQGYIIHFYHSRDTKPHIRVLLEEISALERNSGS